MFICYLCEVESVYTSWFCNDCRKIKNIMNVYGKENVIDILEKVCLRDGKQQTYKIEKEIKDTQNTDKSFLSEIKTRSKGKDNKDNNKTNNT